MRSVRNLLAPDPHKHGLGWMPVWVKWMIFWRLGVANLVAYVVIFGALAGGWAYINQEQRLQCQRSNDGGRVVRELVTSVQIAQRIAAANVPSGIMRTPQSIRAEQLTDRALAQARRKLKPRRC